MNHASLFYARDHFHPAPTLVADINFYGGLIRLEEWALLI